MLMTWRKQAEVIRDLEAQGNNTGEGNNMSRTPFFYIEKYNNKTGKYDIVQAFHKDYLNKEIILADVWPYNGTHDLFDILENNQYGVKGIKDGVPVDADEYIAKKYEECKGKFEGLPAHWFFWDSLLLSINNNPKVPSYLVDNNDDSDNDSDSENQLVETPLLPFANRVVGYIDIAETFGFDSSETYRIIYWII